MKPRYIRYMPTTSIKRERRLYIQNLNVKRFYARERRRKRKQFLEFAIVVAIMIGAVLAAWFIVANLKAL